jgi:hypothetical protein
MANRPNPSQSEDERDGIEDDDVRGLAEDEGNSEDDALEDEEFTDENEDEE